MSYSHLIVSVLSASHFVFNVLVFNQCIKLENLVGCYFQYRLQQTM